MKKKISLCVCLSFVAWIVPLGAFIEAAQEKQICNGRRAVCLCTLYYQKLRQEQKETLIEQHRHRADDELTFPSFGAHFLCETFYHHVLFQQQEYIIRNMLKHTFLYHPVIDPVPKIS